MITDHEAALAFVGIIYQKVNSEWNNVCNLKTIIGDKFVFKDQEKAKWLLTIAVVAIELDFLSDKISEKRLYQIILFIYDSISDEEVKRWFTVKLKVYREKILESKIQYARNNKYSPYEELICELMKDWFTDNISEFYLKNYKVINPATVMLLNPVVLLLAGYWKELFEKYLIDEN